jgi:hypothetical protein
VESPSESEIRIGLNWAGSSRIVIGSWAPIEFDGREANGFGFVVDAKEERRLASIDVDAHYDPVAHAFGNDDLMGFYYAVVARRAPVFLELVEVVCGVLSWMLLPVGVVIPEGVCLLQIAGFDGGEELIDTVIGGPMP